MPRAKNNWNDLLKVDKRRSKGTLDEVRQSLFWFMRHNEATARQALADNDAEQFRRCANSQAQLATVYAKITMDSDVEQRLAALEQTSDAAGR